MLIRASSGPVRAYHITLCGDFDGTGSAAILLTAGRNRGHDRMRLQLLLHHHIPSKSSSWVVKKNRIYAYPVMVLLCTGGSVVHMASGWAALVAAIYIGKNNEDHEIFGGNREPANVPFVVLGTGILWMGWFGVGLHLCTCLPSG